MACNRWRIAATEVGLDRGLFISHRLPMPETIAFQDWSEELASAEGATNRAGYVRCVMAWTRITRPQLFKFRRIVTSLGRNVPLFMTVDRNNGTKGSEEWIDISGYPLLSDPPADAVARKTRQSYDVTLTLNNITIIGDAY